MTNTKTVRGASLLLNVAASRYDANALTCESIVVEWSALHVAETHGVEAAAKAWKAVNAKRNKLGKYTSIPSWGTPMFAAYFA